MGFAGDKRGLTTTTGGLIILNMTANEKRDFECFIVFRAVGDDVEVHTVGMSGAALDEVMGGHRGRVPQRDHAPLRLREGRRPRVVAYGTLLGADRVATMRTRIHDAIKMVETSLSEEDAAIVQRFQNIWEEIELDRARNGGML